MVYTVSTDILCEQVNRLKWAKNSFEGRLMG
jgi:hypothetical protein